MEKSGFLLHRSPAFALFFLKLSHFELASFSAVFDQQLSFDVFHDRVLELFLDVEF